MQIPLTEIGFLAIFFISHLCIHPRIIRKIRSAVKPILGLEIMSHHSIICNNVINSVDHIHPFFHPFCHCFCVHVQLIFLGVKSSVKYVVTNISVTNISVASLFFTNIDRSFSDAQSFTSSNIELLHQSYTKDCTTCHLLTAQKFI